MERLAGEFEGNAVSAKQPQVEQASVLDARIFSDLELLPQIKPSGTCQITRVKGNLPNYIHIFASAVLINCI